MFEMELDIDGLGHEMHMFAEITAIIPFQSRSMSLEMGTNIKTMRFRKRCSRKYSLCSTENNIVD